jgi:hypothetical protein
VEKDRTYWKRRVKRFLCDKTRPSEKEWRDLVRRLAEWVGRNREVLESIGGPSPQPIDPREPLIWAWTVLIAAPDSLKRAYAELEESNDAGDGIEDVAERLRDNGYAIGGLPTAMSLHLPWLAALVRALDADLAGLSLGCLGEGDNRYRVPGYECHVIPVERPWRLKKGRQPERRAMRYHAVLPSRLGELEIKIAARFEIQTNWASQCFGAAMFEDMQLSEHFPGTPSIVMASAHLANIETLLADQIASGEADGCTILAWPELSMPGASEATLRGLLRSAPLREGRVPVVVAGSWHVACPNQSDTFANESVLLDGRGRTLATYRKRIPFVSKGRSERIELGRELLVLASADALISIAICRDFCDDTPSCGYDDLPLDMIVIPSMGGAETLAAQLRHAKMQQSKQGSATFLIQQRSHPTDATPPVIGYSFVGDGDSLTAPYDQTVSYRCLTQALLKPSRIGSNTSM